MKLLIALVVIIIVGIFISVDYQERVEVNICPENSETIDKYRSKRVNKLQEAKATFKLWEEQLNLPDSNSRDLLMDEYRNQFVSQMDEAIDFGIIENFTLLLEEQCYTPESVIEADEYLLRLKTGTYDRISEMNILTKIPYDYPVDIFAKLGEDINLP